MINALKNGLASAVVSNANLIINKMITMQIGDTAPISPSQFILWADTSEKRLKMKLLSNNWIILGRLDERSVFLNKDTFEPNISIKARSIRLSKLKDAEIGKVAAFCYDKTQFPNFVMNTVFYDKLNAGSYYQSVFMDMLEMYRQGMIPAVGHASLNCSFESGEWSSNDSYQFRGYDSFGFEEA